MKKIIYNIFFLLIPCYLFTQEKFIYEGKIEFERKINVQRQAEGEDYDMSWFKDVLSKLPAFHNSIFSLQFNGDQTMYGPVGEVPVLQFPWLIGPAKENIIVTDLNKQFRQSFKSVFEQKYIISDSLKQTEWRITDEKRTIAGMECRKAVTVICDSVYVVAFYTDEIPVTGGPESFNGLPGMILGIAIPRLYTTWFATKVTLSKPALNEFKANQRGQKTDEAKLRNTLKRSLGDWGKYGERNSWWILL
jgi:GLPGLI family protein